jgi:hypothetical protein
MSEQRTCLAHQTLSMVHSVVPSADGALMYMVCGVDGCTTLLVVTRVTWDVELRRRAALTTADEVHPWTYRNQSTG